MQKMMAPGVRRDTEPEDMEPGADPSTALHQIVYISTATAAFSVDELSEMLHKFREDNRRADITGILLYSNRRIMQCIEGPRRELEALYGRIQADPRHCLVMAVVNQPAAKRQFERWSMAFPMESSDFDPSQIEGYRNLEDLDFQRLEQRSRSVALGMLAHFKDYLEHRAG